MSWPSKKVGSDPLLWGRNSISDVIADARASLQQPSRPFTPRNLVQMRTLHVTTASDQEQRPSTPGILPQAFLDLSSNRPVTPAVSLLSQFRIAREKCVPGLSSAVLPPQNEFLNSQSSESLNSEQDVLKSSNEPVVAFESSFSKELSIPPNLPSQGTLCPCPPTRTAPTASSSYRSNRPLIPSRSAAIATNKSLDSQILNLCCQLDSEASAGSVEAVVAQSLQLLSAANTAADGCSVSEPMRRALVKSVSTRMSTDDPQRLLDFSSVLLAALQPGSSRNRTVVKVIYKVSKTSSNDAFFASRPRLLQLMADVIKTSSDFDAVLYTLGCIKNISGGGGLTVALALAANNIPDAIKRCLTEPSPSKVVSVMREIMCSACVCLRNLATFAESRAILLNCGIVTYLLPLLIVTHVDVTMCAARALCKLCVDKEFFCSCNLNELVAILLQSLQLHPDSPDIIVRVAFVLGNALELYEDGRLAAGDADGTDVLCSVAARYSSRFCSVGSSEGDLGTGARSVPADVLVKILRCLANLSLTPRLRAQVARHADVSCIIDVLAVSESDSSRNSFEEELVLNAVAAVHNLVYAALPDNNLWMARLQLLPHLMKLLFDSNASIVAEAASAMANICIADDVRVAANHNRAFEVCAMLLDHSDISVCTAVCGLIMNLSANPACASHLLEACAHFKLVEVAVACSFDEVGGNGGTSSTACKALANVLLQGSGGCIKRSFAEPASRALAEVKKQLQQTAVDSSKLLEDLDLVLRLLIGPSSLSITEDSNSDGDLEVHEGLEHAQVQSSHDLEEL